MIKIKLYELEKHRAECTFRPYIAAQNTLREIGIEFTQGDSYDYAWISQVSFMNKKVPLQQSIDNGLEFLSKVTGDYMLLDGQDSTSLMGSIEVFRGSNAILLLKNSLLKDRSLYEQSWNLGRYYWGKGEYAVPEFEQWSDKIRLSGTNWISTHWAGTHNHYINALKEYDVAAMFQYPSLKSSYEHGRLQSGYYDEHRKPVYDVLNRLPYNVAKLDNGQRVSAAEYYNRMATSKIVIAPFGYGEMAPRDLEAMRFGCILIKPDMGYIDTTPNIYIPNETYIPCKHDFSDLEDKIHEILGNYQDYQYIVENARKHVELMMHPNWIADHLYSIFKDMV